MKRKAIIVDIDGTVAHMCDRGIYEHEKAGDDTCDNAIRETVTALYAAGYRVIFCSGRFETHREVTESWLTRHFSEVVPELLLMRKDGDYRSDDVVKEDIYRTVIEPAYNVLLTIDDRNRVVDMWRRIGLTCLQVAPGDF